MKELCNKRRGRGGVGGGMVVGGRERGGGGKERERKIFGERERDKFKEWCQEREGGESP